MKPSIIFLLTLLLALLFSGSTDRKSKDPAILNSGLVEVTSSNSTHNTIITVHPNGNDDTDNLYATFNRAIAAGTGSIVQLTAGNFLISRPIVIADFSGTFRGAGKDLTRITNLDNVPFPLATNLPSNDLFRTSTLFCFYQTSKDLRTLEISDISFEVKGKTAGLEYSGWKGDNFVQIIEVLGQVNNLEELEPPSMVNCSFKNVGFFAEMSNNFEQNNANFAIWLFDEFYYHDNYWYQKFLSGTYSIQKCTFKNFIWAINMGAMVDSKVIIGGDKKSGNEFEDVIGCITNDFSNSVVDFSYNKMKNIYGKGFYNMQGWEKPLLPEQIIKSSEFFIKNNDFHCIKNGDGIYLEDLVYLRTGRVTSKVTISDNFINLDNTLHRGISGFYLKDVLVKNNTIVGNGLAGIYVGACPNGDCAYSLEPSLYTDLNLCSGWEIVGNNVKDVNATIAPIYLGPGSSNCLVVGDGNLTNVLDEGTNNKLVNTDRAVPK